MGKPTLNKSSHSSVDETNKLWVLVHIRRRGTANVSMFRYLGVPRLGRKMRRNHAVALAELLDDKRSKGHRDTQGLWGVGQDGRGQGGGGGSQQLAGAHTSRADMRR